MMVFALLSLNNNSANINLRNMKVNIRRSAGNNIFATCKAYDFKFLNIADTFLTLVALRLSWMQLEKIMV